jgi:hypothetical protein
MKKSGPMDHGPNGPHKDLVVMMYPAKEMEIPRTICKLKQLNR